MRANSTFFTYESKSLRIGFVNINPKPNPKNFLNPNLDWIDTKNWISDLNPKLFSTQIWIELKIFFQIQSWSDYNYQIWIKVKDSSIEYRSRFGFNYWTIHTPLSNINSLISIHFLKLMIRKVAMFSIA